MPQQRTFAQLVEAQVRRIGYREFEKRAVDPQSGYSPSKRLIGVITNGGFFQVNDRLMRAIIAGLDEDDRPAAKIAAIREILGFDLQFEDASDPFPEAHAEEVEVTVPRDHGVTGDDLPENRAELERVLREINEANGGLPDSNGR